MGFSRYSKRVSESQVTPLFTLAAVYEKPSTWPDLRPKILCAKNTEVSCRVASTTISADEPVQVGANLVGLTGTDGVALSAPSLEEGSTFGRVTYDATGHS